MRRRYWLIPGALALLHIGLFARGARSGSGAGDGREVEAVEEDRPSTALSHTGAGVGAALSKLSPSRCEGVAALRQRYDAALLKAADATGPEGLLEVGQENHQLADQVRQRLANGALPLPAPAKTDVVCRASACRIAITVTSAEPRQRLTERIERGIRDALAGMEARRMGLPPLKKGGGPQGESVEFVVFITVGK
jgi:hypothetical protein